LFVMYDAIFSIQQPSLVLRKPTLVRFAAFDTLGSKPSFATLATNGSFAQISFPGQCRDVKVKVIRRFTFSLDDLTTIF